LDHADLNVVRHAFEIVIKLATGGLAGTDAGSSLGLPDVARSLQESVAAWACGVTDGNGAGMAVAVDVIGALACHAIRDHRHFKGNLVHGMSSFQVMGQATGLNPVGLLYERLVVRRINSGMLPARLWILPVSR